IQRRSDILSKSQAEPTAICQTAKRHCRFVHLTTDIRASPENRRKKEFNNCRAKVRQQADRQSVEWLCRRDGGRLRACWPVCDGCQGTGESGCRRGGRRAVCQRTGRAGRPKPQPVAFELAQVVTEL